MFDLKAKLSLIFQKEIELELKDNRFTFLRAKIQKNKIKLILHKAFLNAPDEIFLHLKQYLINKNRNSLKELKKYIERHLKNYDYSHRLKIEKLRPEGKVYHLKNILSDLKASYFSDFDLNITWFKKRKFKRRLTFGSYNSSVKLIKINEILDDDFFPIYFVSYVVYHEILHHIFPVKMKENGNRIIHGKEFKQAEKKYLFYKEAKSFEKEFLKKGNFHVGA